MTDVFQNVLTASFHGSIVILAVILLRLLLKQTPKKFLCFLWLLAGIRLLMPFEIQSDLSLQPDVEPFRTDSRVQVFQEDLPEADLPVILPETPAAPETVVQKDPVFMMPAEPLAPEQVPGAEVEEEPDVLMTLDAIAANIWLAVAVGFGLYTLVSYLRLKLQVREAIRMHGNVWECDRIETAFILGFIRPQIYLPMGMSRNNRRHILAHERTHLEKGDHWIKMIGFVALAIHWFNPLVWVAYILLCKDIEMACDERVVQFMELEERKSYSAALINCSTNHAHFAACPVAFGEVSVKNRVLSVLKYRKPSFWISLAGVIAIIFVAVCFVTSPTENEAPLADEPEVTEETLPPREMVTVSTVDELLSAIAPGTEIILEAGVYNLSEASSYGNAAVSEYCRWEQVSDGYELILEDLDNFAIRGSGTHVTLIETDPRFADVIALQNCSDVELEGFTGGHTRLRGECGGGVVYLSNSRDVTMHQLGLYGCGMVGLETVDSSEITMTDCDIYDCSFAAVILHTSRNATISGCRMYNIGQEPYGGYTYLEQWESTGVVVENCEFSDSNLSNLLCTYGGEVEMKNNLIANNRVTASAMVLQGMDNMPCDVTLSGNKFDGNSIRSWYSTSTATAVDEKGRLLTEDVLMDAYGTEPTEPAEPQLQIHVSTVDEFIAAIGPNKEIILDAALYDFSTATVYGTSTGEYYFWENIFDGPGLVIQNVSNLTIRSNDGNVKGHTLAAVPRYADVLAFRACDNITLSGFTAGHTQEQGSCAGGVLEFRDCDEITVDNCGLFGCGILGVETQSCAGVTVKNCDIYDCSNGGIQMWDTYGVTLENNTFRDIGGRYIMQFNSCKNVSLDGEEIIGETLYSHGISSPEQDELAGLQNIVWYFADHFCDGDKNSLSGLLASTYTGEITVWDNTDGLDNAFLPDVTLETLATFKRNGKMEFSVPIQPWSYEQSMYLDTVAFLNFTVIREKDEYKVSDYYLVQNEA